MCATLNAIGRLIFDPANVTGIFGDAPSTPKITMDTPYTPSAAALQSQSSVGTGAKVQLGKQEKDASTASGGLGSRTGGKSSIGGITGGAGLRI